MLRIPIRDFSLPNCPRIMDYIVNDDGIELLEYKVKNVRKSILVNEVKKQIKKEKERLNY